VIGPVDTLNPFFASSSAENALSQLMFSQILSYDTSGNLNYDLAQNVSVSQDGKTYHVTLRSDVRWHDGRRLTADDVVFTTELLKDPVTRTEIKGWDSVRVKKTSDYSVDFTLNSTYAPFMTALTFPVLPKHILGDISHESLRENDFSTSPVGTGPFSFRLLQDVDNTGKQKIIHLTANDHFYKGAPKLARVQVLVVPDEAAEVRALKLNEVNSASGLSAGSVGQLSGSRYVIDSRPIQSGVYAFLNNDSEILSDVNVRKALQLATNTEEVRAKVGGSVPALPLPFTSLQLEDDSTIKTPEYDVKRARETLDTAGWKLVNGVRTKDGKALKLTVVTTKNSEYERALETLIGQWRQLGIQIEENIVDAADPVQNFVSSVLQQRSYDVLLYQISMGRDPDVFAYWHSSQAVARGLNLSNYSSPEADDILASARSTNNVSLRNAKHVAFAKQWLADVPAIGLYQSTLTTASTRSINGRNESAVLITPQQRYNDILYWTVEQRTVYKTP
jgi:peptide/nickel transport system substrate-binding protein